MARKFKEYFDQNRKILGGIVKAKGKNEKRTVEIRRDPLFGLHCTLISVERTKRPRKVDENQGPQKLKPSSDCPFCKQGGLYTETAEDRSFHKATIPSPGYELITFSNLYPFVIPHKITVICDSIDELDLLNLQQGDMERYLESCFEIASELEKMDGIVGMFDFINWGAKAGASIDHPHAQRGGLVDLIHTLADEEADRCEAIKESLREDPFEIYLNAIRKARNERESLYCFENEAAIVCCPFAPRFSDQVDVIYKKQVNNILRLRQNERIQIAHAMTKALHSLARFNELPNSRRRNRVTDVDIALHQARFDDKRDYYHIHWHITPRMNPIGSLESNYNVYVVDTYPETTAEDIRIVLSNKP